MDKLAARSITQTDQRQGKETWKNIKFVETGSACATEYPKSEAQQPSAAALEDDMIFKSYDEKSFPPPPPLRMIE